MQQPQTNAQEIKVVGWHDLREMATILVKHHGLHEGLYDLAIQFQISIGAVGPNPASMLPGSMVGVQNIGLVYAAKEGPTTVNAAQVNPITAT